MSTAFWQQGVDELEAAGLGRRLNRLESGQGPTIRREGRVVINFASNDYLSLAADERVIDAAVRAARDWGWGAAASRLVSGTFTPHRTLETRLAEFFGAPAALVFGSGYHANLAAVRAGAGKGDVIFSDERNHASLIDGARLSGARVVVFPHRDYDALNELLARHAGPVRRLIVTESLFSVDGGFASLPRLVELKERHDAVLCVDEAHAFGVFGDHGRGLAEMQNVEGRIDMLIGTLSKALGGAGGFICGSQALVDWLVNTARTFIFSTAPPPAVCAAATAALDIVEQEPERRANVLASAARLRTELGDVRGHDLSTTQSQIVPVVIGDPARTVELAEQLLDRGLFVPAFRPPSVPSGSARLRISVTAGHEPGHLDTLLKALDELVIRSV